MKIKENFRPPVMTENAQVFNKGPTVSYFAGKAKRSKVAVKVTLRDEAGVFFIMLKTDRLQGNY